MHGFRKCSFGNFKLLAFTTVPLYCQTDRVELVVNIFGLPDRIPFELIPSVEVDVYFLIERRNAPERITGLPDCVTIDRPNTHFSVCRGKAGFPGGCESHPATVTSAGSSQGRLCRQWYAVRRPPVHNGDQWHIDQRGGSGRAHHLRLAHVSRPLDRASTGGCGPVIGWCPVSCFLRTVGAPSR